MFVLYIILLIAFTFFTTKVNEWNTMITLWSDLGAPLKYVQNPQKYYVIGSALLIGIVILSFTISAIPWYMGIGILIVAGWIATSSGKKRALRKIKEWSDDNDSSIER